jgi:RNA polymerase sigma-70 factor (ECF subfamily)
MLVYLQMIETAAERDRFQALYEAYRGLMFHVANKVLQNTQDAEDAVHLAFVSIAEHIDGVPAELGPQARSLVVTIAERKAIDLYRAKRKHPMVDLDELPLSYDSREPDGTLAGAMAALPPRYREVLLLKYYNGYSTEEVASFLSETSGNIRQIISRAKKKLAAELAERGETAYDHYG